MAQSEQSCVTFENKVNKFDGRILRNRHYKRPFADNRPVKRLFTPEIKRHLKTWLIRRRENPYPSREEKLKLASQTGLTYIQICNWFANWRRKLKKSGKNVSKFNWGALIKSYNDQALGNVEHLSISSDDSIWEEPDTDQSKQNEYNQIFEKSHNTGLPPSQSEKIKQDFSATYADHAQSSTADGLHQCFQISSTTDFIKEPIKPKSDKKLNLLNKPVSSKAKTFQTLTGKNKKHRRDKNWNYKRMVEQFRASANFDCSKELQTQKDPFLLSKWRKSVALFQPDFNIYSTIRRYKKKNRGFYEQYENLPGREELDAAEALTFLSRAKQF